MTTIPTRRIGPLCIVTSRGSFSVHVPMATYEKPLWHSTQRGMRVARICGGIHAVVLDDKMTRSTIVEGPTTAYVHYVERELARYDFQPLVLKTSQYAKLLNWNTQIVGNLLYIRWSFDTSEASGHNMATKAAEALLNQILSDYPQLTYVSISGNYCTDKKVSAVNGILGRGKYTIAELTLPHNVCAQHLKTTPQKIVDLHVKKNLIGSILSGSVRSANAHFANMLLATYLPTGQDAANIVEGSQGIVHANVLENEALYFSVTLPNIIVGVKGNGKDLPFVQENLRLMDCTGDAKKLAKIIAATVLCGELSLLAAQTNQGELVQAHMRLERS